jgi:hypothetical protein
MNTSDLTTGCYNLLCTIRSALHIIYTGGTAVVLLHAVDQFIKQPFYAITVLPNDDGPVRPETCSS